MVLDTKNIVLISSLFLFFLLESLNPHYKGRTLKGQLGHTFKNILISIFNAIITALIFSKLFLFIFNWIEKNSIGFLYFINGSKLIHAFLGVLLFDLWMYIWHLINHNSRLLWKFHRMHHTDLTMDASTAIRFHPGEIIFSSLFRIPVFIIVGINPVILLIHGIILNVSTIFHHSNFSLPESIDRTLRIFIVTPNMHRVHHSEIIGETNSNYTSILSVWDRLFKTFKKSNDTKKIKLGLIEFSDKKWQELSGMIITPFVKIKRSK